MCECDLEERLAALEANLIALTETVREIDPRERLRSVGSFRPKTKPESDGGEA